MSGRISYHLELEDHVAGQRSWHRDHLRSGRSVLIILAFGVALAAVGGWIIAPPGAGAGLRWTFALGTGAAMIGWILLSHLIVHLLVLPRQARRMFRQQNLPLDGDIAWDPDGMTFTSSMGEARFRWDQWHRWQEIGRAFMFYANERLFYVVPKSGMTPEEADDLRATAEAVLGPAGARVARSGASA